jgi:hypothetical protein
MPLCETVECTEKRSKSWFRTRNTLAFDRDPDWLGTLTDWFEPYVSPYGGRYAPPEERDTLGA